jgi:tRNA(Ile)-lysidine synthase TilS/MesJ
MILDRVCKKCVLDSKTPGVTISEETGLCQFCEHYIALSPEKIKEFRLQMDTLFNSPPHHRKYDVIIALSGGMDSCYTLLRLKNEYPHLNILAVQFDNSFISNTAFENARKFCELTKSTYSRITLDNNLLRDTIKKTALSKDAYQGFAKNRASDVCNTCISIIKQKIIEIAIQTKTPFIVFGFSPGQTKTPFVTLKKPFIIWMRDLFESQLKAIGVSERKSYLIDENILQSDFSETQIIIIHPFLAWGYNKQINKETCIKSGWIAPDMKDHNSSNCLLNAFAIHNHMEKNHIHPYAYDLSALVRHGCMEREEAIEKLKVDVSDPSIQEVKRALDL